MSLKELRIKAGSILLYKKYSWFRKLLIEKILKKELPYNEFTAFAEESTIVSTSPVEGIMVEPVKKYNNKESMAMSVIFDSAENIDDETLFLAINIIRPNTFAFGESDLTKLLSSKYYKVRDLSNETEYNEYIY